MPTKKIKSTYKVGKNGHIIITYDEFDNLCDKISELNYTADDYLPTEEQLHEIERDFPEYFKLLLWIDATGETTEENKEIRRKIKDLINNNIDFIDDEKE